MGLLDAFSTPDAQLGFGLLAAAAPSMAPMNFAGRLAQGNQNFKDLQTKDLANQTAAQNLQMNNIALQRSQQEWGLQLPMLQAMAARLGGGQAAPQGTTPAPQSAPQAAPQIGTNSSLGGVPLFSSGVTSTPAPQQPAPQQAPQQTGSMFPGVPDSVAYPTAAFGGFKALLPLLQAYNTPTDATKMANQAGVDVQAANRAALLKATNIAPISGRPGGYMVNPVTGAATQLPHVPDGYTAYQDTNGQFHIAPLDGGAQAIYGSARALEGGKGSVIPQAGYNPQTGQYGFTNRTAAATGANPPGVNAGPFSGYTPAGQPPLAPQPAPGTIEAADAQATQNAKRSGSLVDAAADSPMRVNVLDNILNLSKQGVATGPTADFTNKIKGVVASIPGFPGWQNDVTGYQEMKKFLNQNAIRAWTAAGGTGTDSQMNAAMQANPNDKMFPQAVQTMAQWAKAGELALQAKASAQDAWLAQHQNNPQAQNQFESTWRQNFDPRVYQMSLMTRADRAAFMAKQLDAAKLKAKVGTALQNGWVQ